MATPPDQYDELEIVDDPIKSLDVTFVRAFKVWWSLLWRGLLYGALIGGLMGFIVGFIGALAGVNPQTLQPYLFFGGMALGLPVGVAVLQIILRKSWSDFRIVLVPKDR